VRELRFTGNAVKKDGHTHGRVTHARIDVALFTTWRRAHSPPVVAGFPCSETGNRSVRNARPCSRDAHASGLCSSFLPAHEKWNGAPKSAKPMARIPCGMRGRLSARHGGICSATGPRFRLKSVASGRQPAPGTDSGSGPGRSPGTARVPGCEPDPRAPHLVPPHDASRNAPQADEVRKAYGRSEARGLILIKSHCHRPA
jgi:hypothetical protein